MGFQLLKEVLHINYFTVNYSAVWSIMHMCGTIIYIGREQSPRVVCGYTGVHYVVYE